MNDNVKNYFIKKSGYQTNSQRLTRDDSSQKHFWDERNIRLSRRAQHDVYNLAYDLAVKNSLKNILDVGCGVGSQLNQFFDDRFNIYGIDQPHAVDYCKKKYKRGIYVADDLENPTYAMKQHVKLADMVICADVIEHLQNPDFTLSYIKQFVNENTLVILSTPERDSLHGANNIKPTNPYHVREWNSKELHDYIISHGFDILEHSLVNSNVFGFNFATAFYFADRFLKRLPIKHTQVVVCKLSKQS